MNKTEHWECLTNREQQDIHDKAHSDILDYLLRGVVPKGMVEEGWKNYGKGFADCLKAK